MWGRYTSGILNIFGQRFGHPPTVLAAGLQAASAPNHLTLAFSENVGGSLVVSDLD